MVTLSEFNDDDVLNVTLECGHHRTISISSLRALTPKQCKEAQCDDASCLKRILTAEDFQLIALDRDREQRARWLFEQIEWERMDGPVINNITKVELTAEILFDSLSLARVSMQAPRSVTPRIVDPTCLHETSAIMKHIRKALDLGNTSFIVAPSSLMAQLREQSLQALKQTSAFGTSTWFALTISSRLRRVIAEVAHAYC